MQTSRFRRTAIASVVAVIAAMSIAAQTPGGSPGRQVSDTGLQNAWDVRKTIADVQKDAAALKPLLALLSPQDWAEKKGAPTTYIIQWQSAQQQLNDVMNVTARFSQQPDSLAQGLDTYFRLESLEVAERSLAEGAQRYDTRQNAERLNQMIAHNFSNREGLREYLRELATSTEENFKVADQEAQRCRGLLIQQNPPASAKKTRKN